MASELPQDVFAGATARIKAAVDIPVLLTGGIRDPEVAQEILASGQADMVGMVWAHIVDPAWLAKVKAGTVEDLGRCTGDNEECRTRTQFQTKAMGPAIGGT